MSSVGEGDAAPTLRKRRKEARPSEIIAVALELFAQKGFAGTKMEEIAARAGVAKGTVYLYFPTKESLFETAVRENIATLMSSFDTAVMRSGHTAEAIVRMLITRLYAEMVNDASRRTLIQVIITEGIRFPHLCEIYYNEVIANGQKVLQKVIQRGIASGEFRETGLVEQPIVLISPAIIAVLWQLNFQRLSPIDMDRHRDAHIEMLLASLRKST